MKPIPLGVDARCSHGEPLAMGEDQCDICRWEADIADTKVPFTVRCISDKDTDLKTGTVYTVAAVIVQGKVADSKTSFPCYLLRTTGQSSATLKGYYFGRFARV